MAEFTLLKLNFEDSDLTANAPYSRGDGDGNGDADPADAGNSSKKGTVLAALVGLCFCVAVAYLVRKRAFGGSGDENSSGIEDADDLDSTA
jgi:hypothetical protein